MHLLYSFLSSLWALLSLPLIHQDCYQALQWQGDTSSPLKRRTAEELVDAEVEIRQDDSARRHPASPHSSNTNNHPPDQKCEVGDPLPNFSSQVQPLCAYCRSLTLSFLTSPAGCAFHQTLSDIRAYGKNGCRLCAFLGEWSTGILSPDGTEWLTGTLPPDNSDDTEWSLVPWGRFNGICKVSQVARERLRKLQKGRLYAIEVFEGAGKGLVGMFDKRPDREADKWFYWALRIGEGEGCDKLSNLYGIPVRRPLTNTGSISSLNTAKRWLAVCDASHDCYRAQLPSSKSSQSPASRLLDLRAFGQPCLDVRLVETWEEEDTSQYIALSHRWGTKSQPMTTKHSTIQERRSRIPFASLPLTFRHAVQITRDLGVRYLWIDSLCIIQDSVEDWEVESSRMGAIYMHSYVTLAADSSRSSDAGLFNTQSVLQDEGPLGEHIRLDVSTGDTGGKRSSCDLYISSELEVPKNVGALGPVTSAEETTEDKDDPDESLVKRGWTLQEAVLPSRVLHFTSKQLIWECSQTGYEAEDMFSLNLRYMRPSFTEMKAKLMPQLGKGKGDDAYDPARGLRASEVKILRAWYCDLIEFRYSGRRLTYGIDKLPAIAGLADLASQTLDSEYIAGMWKKGMEWALTWRVCQAEAFTEEKKRQPYRSPSFSWACSNSLFMWPYPLETFQRTAQVEDTHVEPRCSSNPFGCLQEGCRIRITGWVSRQAVKPHGNHRNVLQVCIGDKVLGKIYMDRVPDDAEPCSVVCIELGLGMEAGAEMGFPDVKPRRKDLLFLVLVPIQGEQECYTRFGQGEFFGWDERYEGYTKYMGSREWRTITIY